MEALALSYTSQGKPAFSLAAITPCEWLSRSYRSWEWRVDTVITRFSFSGCVCEAYTLSLINYQQRCSFVYVYIASFPWIWFVSKYFMMDSSWSGHCFIIYWKGAVSVIGFVGTGTVAQPLAFHGPCDYKRLCLTRFITWIWRVEAIQLCDIIPAGAAWKGFWMFVYRCHVFTAWYMQFCHFVYCDMLISACC